MAMANATTLKRVSVDQLRTFCEEVLRGVGVGASDAKTTADVLVTTDAWGVFTHGVKALRGYVRRLRGGGLRATSRPSIVSQGPAWAIVDGQSALGMVTSVFAMQAAIEKARTCGVGYVGVRNSCHFGAAGYYAHLAAAEGMIGMAMANDTPSVAAPGSRSAVTGSNPLAYAIPTGSSRSILLDMATSTVAGGKVAAAHALGKTIPDHWVINNEGLPTTNPADFFADGALTPMAGHKGFGVALWIEALSGLMSGALVTKQILRWIVDDPKQPTGHGAAFLAFDVAAMQPMETFKSRVDALVEEIRHSPRAKGIERIYLPGEMEWERLERANAEGIEFPDDVIASIRGLAEDLGLDLGTWFS